MYKILGLVGPSGCGKDTAARYLANTFKQNYVKLYTTRPQRNNEDDGYHFIGSDVFLQMVLNGSMLNAQEFRGWYYGLGMDALQKDVVNILPMSNVMVEQMREEKNPNIDLKIFYIYTFPKDRLRHILDRETNPDCYEICRRFLSDKEDYEDNINLHYECEYFIQNDYNNKFSEDLYNTYIMYYGKDKMD